MAKIPAIVEGLIDGRQIAAEAGTTILEACRQNGIGVPTLCHHEGLEAEGGCRLCLVEMDGKLLASCQYPLRSSGFKVLTMSDEVKRARRLVIALMLTRAPDSKVVLDLARAYGVRQDPRLNRSPADGCLRCGRCVRACAAAGGEAISLVGRGAGRRVMGPFDRPPVSCLGCLACVRVCPTGIIKFKDDPQSRSVWGRDFEVLSCPSCGRPVGTLEELSRAGADKLCPKCRIRAAGEAFGSVPAPLA